MSLRFSHSLLTYSSKKEAINLYADERDDLGVSVILLKLDITAKGGKKSKGSKWKTEKVMMHTSALSLKATLNLRVQSITGG